MGTSTVPSDFSGVNVARAEESLFSEEGSCPAGWRSTFTSYSWPGVSPSYET